MTDIQPLGIANYRRVVVLTGAGISVASGLPTYRGSGGLWDAESVEKYVTARAVARDPAGVWEFFGKLRKAIAAAQPNPGHLALAAAERALGPDGTVLVVTQNVDGLHGRAGSRDVVEYHGSAWRSRCTACSYARVEADLGSLEEQVPACPQCGAPLRPDIVFFEEDIPVDAAWRVKMALRECDLFLAVGTSGAVWPAADFVRSADYVGARTVFVGPEPMAPHNPYFREQVLGRAEEVLPILLGA
ncbi:MAG TPA: Sir2 family NAD-dependent protein deacetylase [Polyangiaceae bacterium]|nr:Sir2 family NAD-dependent protein deacetylase [Polyangiaceae bacterium]